MSNFIQEFEEDEIEQFNGGDDTSCINPTVTASKKKKRNLPGNPDPEAEVVALSPRTLMATNRYICEVCHKGFQRDQNLQLHRRGHNLPWKLKQRNAQQQAAVAKKRVYVCPEPKCVHHEPSRALGDLTGIKKHFCRKHGEKKWKCDKCSKRYAVQSDWKAHSKICGTREYRCDCGTIFSRKDSFVTHRAFCDALTEENYKMNLSLAATVGGGGGILMLHGQANQELFSSDSAALMNLSANNPIHHHPTHELHSNKLSSLSLQYSHGSTNFFNPSSSCFSSSVGEVAASTYTSATALLQKASEMGAKISDDNSSTIAPILLRGFTAGYSTNNNNNNNLSTPTTTTITASAAAAVEQQISSSLPAAASCKMSATTSSLGRNQHMTFEFGKNMEAGGDEQGSVGYPHNQVTGGGNLYNSSLLMHSSSDVANTFMGMGMEGGGEKMTVDFLGVEPAAAAHSSFGTKRSSYDGNNIMGLQPYPNAHQANHHNSLYNNNLHSEW